MAGIGLGEDVRHLLVFAQFPRRQELEVALDAPEARVGAAMELRSMVVQPFLRAQVSDRRAFETHVHLQIAPDNRQYCL